MSTPGWHPDPGGAPGQYRFWDGATWSAETSADPSGAPGGGGKKAPIGLIIGIVAALAVIALLAIFIVPGLLRGGQTADPPVDTSTPTKSAWNETTDPTTPPPSGPSGSPSSPQPSGGVEVNCAIGNPNSRQSQDIPGKLTDGGLKVTEIPGWQRRVVGVTFAYDIQSQTFSLEDGWYNDVLVGALRVADGFEQPKQAAEAAMQCIAQRGFYDGFTGRKDIWSKAVTISGKPGWHVRSEIRVSGHRYEGDVVDIIVVDPQQGEHLGMYQSSFTIGESAIESLVAAATRSLELV